MTTTRTAEAVVHELKTDPGPWWALGRGKTVELRQNDRAYAVGDYLRLREYDRATGTYNDDHVAWAKVSHVQDGYGLQEGYVALSLDFEVLAPASWRCDGGCHDRDEQDCRMCCFETHRACYECLTS